MKNQLPHSIDLDLSEFDSERNFNQSFNQRYRANDLRPAEKSSSFEREKCFVYYFLLLLMLFPIGFILVGMIYRHRCSIDSHLTLFLTIFGLLTLLYIFVYTILGSTFLTCERWICHSCIDPSFSSASVATDSFVIRSVAHRNDFQRVRRRVSADLVAHGRRECRSSLIEFVGRCADLVDWVHLVDASRGRDEIDIVSSDCPLDSFLSESLRFNRLWTSDLHGKRWQIAKDSFVRHFDVKKRRKTLDQLLFIKNNRRQTKGSALTEWWSARSDEFSDRTEVSKQQH